MTAGLSPLKMQRRERILDTAERMFAADGFRAVTMEGLAEAAGMSKVTLYGYFPHKDALFAAVSDRVAARLIKTVGEALQEGGSPRQRVRRALVAKHRLIHDLVRRSSHATELFAAKDRTSEDRFREADRQIEAMLAAALQGTAEDSGELAQLLLAASQGIANRAENFDRVLTGIEKLCALIERSE